MATHPHERRKYTRLAVAEKVQVRLLSSPIGATAQDISLDGFSIETTWAIPAGSKHRVEFSLPGSSVEADVSCKQCEPINAAGRPAYVVRFAFDQLDPRVRSFVYAMARLIDRGNQDER